MTNRGWVFLGVTLLAATAQAADPPTVAQGEELFTSARLGTNGKSCAGCHPGGRGLEEATTFEPERLVRIVNQCIAKPLAGQPLAPDSADMQSLIMYLRTLAPAGK